MQYTLGEQYLIDSGGDVRKYHEAVIDGQRVAQAWFNALSSADQAKLRSTVHDPFYRTDGNQAIYDAVEYLTRPV